jgi:hypothetical protein
MATTAATARSSVFEDLLEITTRAAASQLPLVKTVRALLKDAFPNNNEEDEFFALGLFSRFDGFIPAGDSGLLRTLLLDKWGGVLGYAALYKRDRFVLWFQALGIHHRAHRRGLGRLLYNLSTQAAVRIATPVLSLPACPDMCYLCR